MAEIGKLGTGQRARDEISYPQTCLIPPPSCGLTQVQLPRTAPARQISSTGANQTLRFAWRAFCFSLQGLQGYRVLLTIAARRSYCLSLLTLAAPCRALFVTTRAIDSGALIWLGVIRKQKLAPSVQMCPGQYHLAGECHPNRCHSGCAQSTGHCCWACCLESCWCSA